MNETFTSQVMQVAVAQTQVSLAQLRQMLGLSAAQADSVVGGLVSQGKLRRVGRGLYQAAEQRPKEIEQRIWQAMRINPTFMVADIAQQAGTTEKYARKVIGRYRRAGWVKAAGQKRTYGSGVAKIWRLTGAGRERLQAPPSEEFRANPLISQACELTRLICTGQALRFADDKAKALTLARKIIESLEKKENNDAC